MFSLNVFADGYSHINVALNSKNQALFPLSLPSPPSLPPFPPSLPALGEDVEINAPATVHECTHRMYRMPARSHPALCVEVQHGGALENGAQERENAE